MNLENLYLFVSRPVSWKLNWDSTLVSNPVEVTVERMSEPTEHQQLAKGREHFGKNLAFVQKLDAVEYALAPVNSPVRRAVDAYLMLENIHAG